MAFQRRALLILDLQKEFLDPSVGRCLLPKLPPPFLAQLEKLLPKFQGRQNDVFWFRSESKEQRDFTDLSVEERIIVVERSSDDESDDSYDEDDHDDRRSPAEEKNKTARPGPSIRDPKTAEPKMRPPPIRPLPQRRQTIDFDADDENTTSPDASQVRRRRPSRPLPQRRPIDDLNAEDTDPDVAEDEDPSLIDPAPREVLQRRPPPLPLSARSTAQKVAGSRRNATRTRAHRLGPVTVRRGTVGPSARPPLLTDAYLSIDSPHPPVAPNTPASQWHAPIEPWIQRNHIVMKKSWYSAFKDTDLLFQLRGRMVSEIYVCGVMSNVGVLATVADAVRHGIACTVIEDCCGYRSGEANARAIDMMVGEFEVEVVKMEDVKGVGGVEGGIPAPVGTVGLPPKVGATAMATEDLLKTLAGIGMPKEPTSEDDELEEDADAHVENQENAVNGNAQETPEQTPIPTPAPPSRPARSGSSGSQSPPKNLQRTSSSGKKSSPIAPPKHAPKRSLEDRLKMLNLDKPENFSSGDEVEGRPIEVDDAEMEYTFPESVKLPGRARMEFALGRGRAGSRGMRTSSAQPWPVFPQNPEKNASSCGPLGDNDLLPGEGPLEVSTPESEKPDQAAAADCATTDTSQQQSPSQHAPPPIPARRASVHEKRAPPPVPDKPKPEVIRRMSQRRSSAAQDPNPSSPSVPQTRSPPHRKTLSSSSASAPAPAAVMTTNPPAPAPAAAVTSSTPPPPAPHLSSAISSTGKPKKKLPKGFQSSAPILSAGDSIGTGDSSLHLSLLPPPLSTTAFSALLAEVQWRTMYHRGGEVPRLVAVQGAINPDDGSFPIYRHPADESPPLMAFTETVEEIRREAEKVVGHQLNHVLIQCYRGGADYISEHADKTLDIARGSSIVNVSLGAQRTMILRRKKPAATDSPAASTASVTSDTPQEPREMQRIPMPHNSLFTLGWNTNIHFQHSIKADKRESFLKTPEELAENSTRISLTFRNIATFLSADETHIWGQGAVAKSGPPGRNIVLGPCPESERLLAAFGKENQMVEFDWDAEYAPGFDILHFVPPVPKLRRVKPAASSAAGAAVEDRASSAAAAEAAFEARKMESILRLKGLHFEIEDVDRPPAPPPSLSALANPIPQETLPAFIDADRERTVVHGAVALVSCLERWHPDVGNPLLPRERGEYVKVVERLVEGNLSVGGLGMREKERRLEERWPVLRALRGLVVVERDDGGVASPGGGSKVVGSTPPVGMPVNGALKLGETAPGKNDVGVKSAGGENGERGDGPEGDAGGM